MLLDVLLVGAVTAMSTEWMFFPLSFPGFFPVLAIYAAVMWKLKGTTIGGIVCGLKVVRLDGREIDWATASPSQRR